MAKLNVKPNYDDIRTHEGAQAWPHASPEQQLRRSVSSCLLWEKQFYEDGIGIAQRIVAEAERCAPEIVAALAVEARSRLNLRHAPLLLLAVLAKTGKGRPGLVSGAIEATIQRADELTEFLAIHAELTGDAPRRFPHQVRKGLARAFRKFDAYQLAKYDRAGAVRLRDALFLCHAKPRDEEQAALWRKLVANDLPLPDTWEVALSGGADKRGTFERLLRERKLGYLALLRNLRNMVEAEVDESLIRDAILARKGAERVLPFRYVAAARAVPRLEPVIDQALLAAIDAMPALSGRTLVVVDVSPSMDDPLSARSDLTRMDAAAALASMVRGDLRVFSFSARGYTLVPGTWNQIQHDGRTPVLVEVPPRRGMAGVDAILNSQERNGTLLGLAVQEANAIPHDRLIVLTDEQSADHVPAPICGRAYMINVGANQNGVGYGRWTHVDGFSESVLAWIMENERVLA